MNNKETIILFFHDSGLSGGTLALLDLIEVWSTNSKYNYICVLPKRNKELEKNLKKLNCEVIIYRYWQAVWNCSGKKIDLFLLKVKYLLGIINTYFYSHKIKKYNPKVIYSNTSSIYNGFVMSKILRVPHIWHIREFVTKEHGVYPIFGEKKHYQILNNIKNKLIFISNSLKKEYEKYIDNENLVIYDDISPHYYLKNIKSWDERKNNILIVGNISKGKRQIDVVEALNLIIHKNNKIKVFFAGKITDKNYYMLLEEKIKQYNLNDNIIFLNQVNEMNSIRENMGIGIISSYKEAFGRVTIEGMLAGMIMIGANDAATKELISNSFNGYLYTLGNIEELANIIEKILKAQLEENLNIIENARLSSQKYISGKCANCILELFE